MTVGTGALPEKSGRKSATSAELVAIYDSAFDDDARDLQVPESWSTDFPVRRNPDMVFPPSDDSLHTLAWRLPTQPRSWIARPSALIRGMWLTLAITLAVLTVFAGLLAHLVADITQQLREQVVQPTQIMDEPLPAAAVLRDSEQYATVLAQRPHLRWELAVARLQALWVADEVLAARQAVAELSQPHQRRFLNPQQRLTVAEFNARFGELALARQMIDEVELDYWPLEQRRQALALVGRLHMAGESGRVVAGSRLGGGFSFSESG